jgi:ferredoxin
MPTITYVLPDTTERELEVPAGQTVMEGSVRNNLPGIVAECGGSCSCATCHVHVAAEWAHRAKRKPRSSNSQMAPEPIVGWPANSSSRKRHTGRASLSPTTASDFHPNKTSVRASELVWREGETQ